MFWWRRCLNKNLWIGSWGVFLQVLPHTRLTSRPGWRVWRVWRGWRRETEWIVMSRNVVKFWWWRKFWLKLVNVCMALSIDVKSNIMGLCSHRLDWWRDADIVRWISMKELSKYRHIRDYHSSGDRTHGVWSGWWLDLLVNCLDCNWHITREQNREMDKKWHFFTFWPFTAKHY